MPESEKTLISNKVISSDLHTHILKIMDSDFKPVKFRGLNYNPNYNIDPLLQCDPYQIETYDKSTNQRK